MDIEVIEADLENPEHCRTVVRLIDSYARGPGGQSAPLMPDALERMIPGLRQADARSSPDKYWCETTL
jgi:hypothetical protein